MYKGVLRYRSLESKVVLEKMEFSSFREGVTCVNVCPKNGAICLEVHFECSDKCLFDVIQKEGLRISQCVADAILFDFGVRINDFEFCSGDVLGEKYVGVFVPAVHIAVHVHQCEVVVGDADRCLKIFDETSLNSFRAMFRAAHDATDDIARFMLLYNILLSIVKDTGQRDVDSLILKIDGSAERSMSLKNANNFETIYTRLRNEIGHPRDGAVFKTTQGEIEFNLNKFKQIVKKAILQYCDRTWV